MDTRTEADVVKRTLALLAVEEIVPFTPELAERVEARKTRRQLQALLAPFKDSQLKATPARLDVLKEFFRKRAKLLIGSEKKPFGTPVLYCYQPYGVNRAMITLLQDLAPVYPDYEILQLLLPHVTIPAGFKTRNYNDFVVTEDGYLIPVLNELDRVRADRNHKYYHPAKRALKKPEELNDSDLLNDTDLITDHSREAWHYAQLISNLIGRISADEVVECDASRANLIELMEKNLFLRRTPAYKESGYKQLMLSLTKKIKTLRELAEFMDENVEKSEWTEFLRTMDREELCRIVIPVRSRSLKTPIQSDEDYRKEQAVLALPALTEAAGAAPDWPDSNNAKKLLVFILAFLQDDLRRDGPEFLNYGRGYFSGLTKQVSRTQVLQLTMAYMDFLLTDKDPRDLEAHLKEKNLTVVSTTCTHLKDRIIDLGRRCAATSEPEASRLTL